MDLTRLEGMLEKRLGKWKAEQEGRALRADLGKGEKARGVAWEELVAWYLQKEEEVRRHRQRALNKGPD